MESGGLPLAGARIVLVDDDVDTLQVLSFILEHAGADVFPFDDGAEALARIQEDEIDVLLSDLDMPRMDGCELIRLVRAFKHSHGGKLPAMALTAYPSPENVQRCRDAGFQTIIGKPAEPADLVRFIRNLLAE